jgi:hypothetical protein
VLLDRDGAVGADSGADVGGGEVVRLGLGGAGERRGGRERR